MNIKTLTIAFAFTLGGLTAHAEELTTLEHFANTKGWTMVEKGEVNLEKPAEFILENNSDPASKAQIFSNGASKNRSGYLITSEKWADHEIDAEFMIPKGSNSGFYVLGRYEIQVFDSHGKDPATKTDMGAVYQRWDMGRQKQGLEPGYEGVPPLVNAAKPYGEWQTINIKFRAPRFDKQKNKTAHAHFVEVTLNGKVVQKNVSAKGPTRVAPLRNEGAKGPLMIQGNHGPVLIRKLEVTSRDYSNVEVSPVEKAESAQKNLKKN